jgi:hypothetical protein
VRGTLSGRRAGHAERPSCETAEVHGSVCAAALRPSGNGDARRPSLDHLPGYAAHPCSHGWPGVEVAIRAAAVTLFVPLTFVVDNQAPLVELKHAPQRLHHGR